MALHTFCAANSREENKASAANYADFFNRSVKIRDALALRPKGVLNDAYGLVGNHQKLIIDFGFKSAIVISVIQSLVTEAKMKIIKLSLALLFLMVILACGTAGSEPAQPPLEPAPTSVPPTEAPPTPIPPTSTATPIPPTSTPEVQQFFTENFQEDYAKNWSYFLRNGNEAKFSLSNAEGGLLFELTGTGIFSYLVYEPFEYEEVRVDATVENLGVNDNNVTLFCRYSPEGGWYEFNIYSSGLYDMFFTKPDSAGNLNYGLIAEGGSNKINMGQAINKYSIICKKDSLTLFINDFETRTVGIPNYVLENGKVGVSVSSFGQVPVKVKVKEVQISQP